MIVVIVVFSFSSFAVVILISVVVIRFSKTIVGHKAIVEHVIVVDFDLGSVRDDKRFGGETQRGELRRHLESNTCQNR